MNVKRESFYISTLVLMLAAGSVVCQFSESQKNLIVRKHNEIRSSVDPVPSDMLFMDWNQEAADLAQQWTNQCRYGSPDVKTDTRYLGYGISDGYLINGGNEHIDDKLLIKLLNAWADAKLRYEYSTGCQTSKCILWTNIIKANHSAIGCGISTCNSAQESGSSSIKTCIMLCLYKAGFPINPNARDYRHHENKACTQCPDAYVKCERNLCTREDQLDSPAIPSAITATGSANLIKSTRLLPLILCFLQALAFRFY